MGQPDADIDFRFKGTTYHLAALSPRGQQWLDATGLGPIVQTVGINRIRRNAIEAGLRTLVNGHDYNQAMLCKSGPLTRILNA